MAGLYFTVTSGAITLTSATALTVLQIVAATNTRVKVKRIEISSNGITPTDAPIQADVLVQTTAGTMTSVTPVKVCSTDTETLQTTAQKNATVPPTDGSTLWSDYYHEQAGILIAPDDGFVVPGGTRLAVKLTPGTLTATTKAIVTAYCEE